VVLVDGGDEVAEDGVGGLQGLDLNSGWNWQPRKKG
jgi:hypothetical protein